MSDHSSDRYSALIESLYDAVGDNQAWSGMAPRIASALDSISVVLKIHHTQGKVQMIETTDNFEITSKDPDWAEYWHRNDLWVIRAQEIGISKILTSQSLTPDPEFGKSAFYHDWCRKLGVYHMVGSLFPIASEGIGAIGIHRARQDPAYSESECRHFADFLAHLQRAFRLHCRLSGLAQTRAAAFAALDNIGIGYALVDRKGRLIFANGQCETILRSTKTIKISNGAMTSSDPILANRLRQLIHGACQLADGKVVKPEATVVITRPERLPITISTAPLPLNWHFEVPHQPCAIMFLCDPEIPTLGPVSLQDQYGLTRTEAAVALELAKGKSLSQIAISFGIGLGTVRSHLKKILSKTGTSRQAEVVTLILRNAAGFAHINPTKS